MIDVTEFNSLYELLKALPDEDSCIVYLEKCRWPNGVVSPFDRDSQVYILGNHQYMCKNTQRIFNVKTGTIFSNTKLPLRKWFMAIWLVLSNKKGVSSMQLARDLHVTQKTAWYLLHRIRRCLVCKNESVLEGEVECDETFVGGKNKNRHRDKKVQYSQGRSFKDKTPVFGMLQRGGDVVAKVVKNTSSRELTPNILRYASPNATLYTDEWIGYQNVDKYYDHYFVDHGRKQYADGNVYTNTIEGFWSILKRGYIGVYHYMSRKHLQNYVNEFVFRYNTRKINDREKFNLLFCNLERRLTYKELVA